MRRSEDIIKLETKCKQVYAAQPEENAVKSKCEQSKSGEGFRHSESADRTKTQSQQCKGFKLRRVFVSHSHSDTKVRKTRYSRSHASEETTRLLVNELLREREQREELQMLVTALQYQLDDYRQEFNASMLGIDPLNPDSIFPHLEKQWDSVSFSPGLGTDVSHANCEDSDNADGENLKYLFTMNHEHLPCYGDFIVCIQRCFLPQARRRGRDSLCKRRRKSERRCGPSQPAPSKTHPSQTIRSAAESLLRPRTRRRRSRGTWRPSRRH